MAQKIDAFFCLQNVIEGFDLTKRHSLILDEVEVDVITKKSVNDDEC